MGTTDMKTESVPEMMANFDLYGLVEDMAQNPGTQSQRVEDIKTVVQTIINQQKQPSILKQADEGERKGETVLHTAIKRLQFTSEPEKEVPQILVDAFPKMLFQDRLNTEYAGQTPLHMAVAKGNIWVANAILTKLSSKEFKTQKSTQLKRFAVGKVFTNTVMMAELPLSIAAVTCDKAMFDLLVEHGAEIDGCNRHGDNACHSLIRYALLYPEKLQDVLGMCKYIIEDPAPYDSGPKSVLNRKLRKKVWLMENKNGYSPLQLAAKFGQHEIFTFIMNLDVYCRENFNDGLFDIKIYDVTEIDAIPYMTPKERTGLDTDIRLNRSIEDVPGRRVISETTGSCQKSILQMLLQLEPGCAFQFLLFPPLRRIIDKKWKMYRWYFYPWFIFHFFYMCFLTWYGIERSQQLYNTPGGFDIYKPPVYERNMFYDGFGIAYAVINSFVGTVYLLEAVIRVIKGHMTWTIRSFTNPYANGTFQIMFVLFSLLVIIDFPLAVWIRSYENYLLLIAIILGWFMFLFFLRALRPFSFFTVMIQKVLIGDLFRFFVILSCELVGFSAAMHMAIQGSPDIDTEFDNFGRVILSMFKLMVGLGEMGMLYQTRHPVLVIFIFIAFIILTTLLMINSLIAMLSRTCTELVENMGTISARDMHWKLQRLSVVLYLESILPRCSVQCVGKKQETWRFNNQMNKRNKVTRYMMEIRSLQNENPDNKEDTISGSWGFRTAQFNAFLHRQALRVERPLSGIRDTFSNFVHRGKNPRVRNEDNKELEARMEEPSRNKSSHNTRLSPNRSKHDKWKENRISVHTSDKQTNFQYPDENWNMDSFGAPNKDSVGQLASKPRKAIPAPAAFMPPIPENQDVFPARSQYPDVKTKEEHNNKTRSYMVPSHQLKMVDAETQCRDAVSRAQTTPLPAHVEEIETPNGSAVFVESATRNVSQSPVEKLEIYHINVCRQCSVNDIIT